LELIMRFHSSTPGVHYFAGCWYGSNLEEGLTFTANDLSNLSASYTQLPHVALMYITQQNDIHHKPYAIFVDHVAKQVIMTIRGTATIQDAVTDALCIPESVSDLDAL
jgi:hypothetical protein